MGMNVYEAGR